MAKTELKGGKNKKMEKQAELNKPIGTIDPERIKLKPAKVKIVEVLIEDTTKSKKVVFLVKHPDNPDPIKISSASYIVDKQIKTVGTWYNLDKEGNLAKGSAVVVILQKIGANTLLEAIGREIDTEVGEKDYLCFKCY